MFTGETRRAGTGISIDFINAQPVILAGLIRAIVTIDLAKLPFVTRITHAVEAPLDILTGTEYAGFIRAFVHIILALFARIARVTAANHCTARVIAFAMPRAASLSTGRIFYTRAAFVSLITCRAVITAISRIARIAYA